MRGLLAVVGCAIVLTLVVCSVYSGFHALAVVKTAFIALGLCSTIYFAYHNDQYRKMATKSKSETGRPSRSTSNELGSGDLASKQHVKQWIERHDDFDTCLPVTGLKGSDGIILKDGNLVISRDERNRHMLIIAKTGSGKTTKLILPVLYNDCMCPHRSTIIIDSKPEMWGKLAGMTRKHNPNKRIMLFNPLDKSRSLSWNILAKVEDDTDAKLIANTVIMATDNPGSKQDSPFFRNNALQLLNGVMVGLLKDPNERLSMPRVHELVHSGMHGLCDWLEAHPHAIRNTKTFVELARSGSQNADTIMSELSMRLSAWDLQAIRATTFMDEIDLEQLVLEPTLFIVELRESELEMLRPMANVIVVELLRFLTKYAEHCPGQALPRPVSLVIDEFASALGRLPDIHVKLNTLRSRNVSIVAAIQSIAQVKANYEKDADSVLAGFSTKILMPALDFQDAEWASKETGTMTVRYTTASTGKNKRLIDYFASRNENINEQIQQRAVLTPDEIGRPADNAATFFMPNTPVFQGHLVPYYKLSEMKERFESSKTDEFNLRDKPIEFEEKLPEPAKPKTQNLTPEEVRKALEESKTRIGWEDTGGSARKWWMLFEDANKENLHLVLNLSKEIEKRNCLLPGFYEVFAASGTTDLEKVLKLLDKKLVEDRRGTVGWDSASESARSWWVALENENADNHLMVLKLIEELTKRNSSIDDFFTAYVDSNAKNVPEVLRYLDQQREGRRAVAGQAEEVMYDGAGENAPIITETAENNGAMYSAELHVEEEIIVGSKPQTIERRPIIETAPAYTNGNGAHAATNGNGTVTKPVSSYSPELQSYVQMSEDLLQQGNINDYRMILELVLEDKSFSDGDLQVLRDIGAKYGVESYV